jgi:SAM-dependent methyltransferase
MQALLAEGMTPDDHLLDIGCGALRLGHKAVAFLKPGHYWGTDASLALMRHGRAAELPDPDRLPEDHLVQDAAFAFPGIPDSITLAIAFGVFTHLPADRLSPALSTLRARFPRLRVALVSLFLSDLPGPCRQADGVVTHHDRPPYHRPRPAVEEEARAAGFTLTWADLLLPRGQALLRLT